MSVSSTYNKTSYPIFAVALVSAVALAGCDEGKLFEPPGRGGSQEVVSTPSSQSTLSLVARVSYDALSRLGDKEIPASTSIGGAGDVGCAKIPHIDPGHVGSHQQCVNVPYVDFRGAGTQRQCVNIPDFYGPSIGTTDVCAGYDWHADISKSGPFKMERAGDKVRATQPVEITGAAGLRGDLAKVLSLSAKSFQVGMTPRLNIGLGLDEQWCPIVSASPEGDLVDNGSVEVVGKNCLGFDLGALGHPEVCAGPANVSLKDALNGELGKHKDDVQKAANSALPCNKVRESVSKQWHALSIKINTPAKQQAFLNIVPTGAAFSGLIAEDTGVKLTMQVNAKTSIDAQAAEAAPIALPKLGHDDANTSSLDVSLNANAPYDFLVEEIAPSLKGKDFKQDTPAGTVSIHIDDIDIYPSGSSIAVGLKINADLPGHYFNTAGWVYIVGRPTVKSGGNAIQIGDLHFATVLDNDFWKLAQVLLEQQILKTLSSRATIDLTKPIADASNQLVDAIAKANIPGVKLAPGKPSLMLQAIAVGNDHLTATANLKMPFDMAIDVAAFVK